MNQKTSATTNQKALDLQQKKYYKGAGRSEIQSAVRAVMEIVAPCPFIFVPDISPSAPGTPCMVSNIAWMILLAMWAAFILGLLTERA